VAPLRIAPYRRHPKALLPLVAILALTMVALTLWLTGRAPGKSVSSTRDARSSTRQLLSGDLGVGKAPGGAQAFGSSDGLERSRPERFGSGPARAASIDGAVRYADGKPAPGAEVLLARVGGAVRALSGPNGGFSATVESGTYRVSAKLASQTGAFARLVVVSAGETVTGLEIRLGQGGAILGRVVSKADGQPLPDADLVVAHDFQNADARHATADSRGAFQIDGLSPGLYEVRADAASHFENALRGISLGPGEVFRLVLELEPAAYGAAQGTVTDPLGQPISGAVVHGPTVPATVQTDENGKYFISAMRVGWTELGARRGVDSWGATFPLEIKDGSTARLDFVLDEMAVLTGRVRLKSGGLPKGPIEVSVLPPDTVSNGNGGLLPGGIASQIANADGTFLFNLPAPRSYNVYARVRVEGVRQPFHYETGNIVSLEPGTTEDVDLILAGDDELHVLVLEPGGGPSFTPLVSVVVGSAWRRATFRADASGELDLRLPEGSAAHLMLVEARNGGRMGSAAARPGAREVAVQLEDSASVFGRVTASGKPVAGFSVRLELLGDSFGLTFGPFEYHPDYQFARDSYEIFDAPGRHVLVIVNTPDGLSGSGDVHLAPGGRAEVNIDLQRGGTIAGRVLDDRTRAPVVADISLDGRGDWLTSDPDGRFRWSGITTGEHLFTAYAYGYQAAKRMIGVSSSQLLDLGDVVLSPASVRSPSSVR